MESGRKESLGTANPLVSDAPATWERLVETLGPASLLVVVEERLGPALRERVRAEDVVQEALLHVWRDREHIEWRGIAPFRRFFLQVVENRIRDLVEHERALKRGGGHDIRSLTPGTDDSTAPPPPEAISTTPSRIASTRERADAMAAALRQLPEDLREVVRLRLFEELTTSEVAEHLGLGLSAVKHRFLKGARLYQERLRSELATRSGDSSAKG